MKKGNCHHHGIYRGSLYSAVLCIPLQLCQIKVDHLLNKPFVNPRGHFEKAKAICIIPAKVHLTTWDNLVVYRLRPSAVCRCTVIQDRKRTYKTKTRKTTKNHYFCIYLSYVKNPLLDPTIVKIQHLN